MDWFKKHTDTVIILGAFAAAFWILNEKISKIENDLVIIKTVMVMKNIMPCELAKKDKE